MKVFSHLISKKSSFGNSGVARAIAYAHPSSSAVAVALSALFLLSAARASQGQTTRVSVASDGTQANSSSLEPSGLDTSEVKETVTELAVAFFGHVFSETETKGGQI
jgi:hypothetical protein